MKSCPQQASWVFKKRMAEVKEAACARFTDLIITASKSRPAI
jgi:hypothetical protein